MREVFRKGRGLGFALLFFAGCSTRIPPAAIEAYDRCDFSSAVKILKKRADQGDKDQVLYLLALLSSSMRAGDWAQVEASSKSALDIMWGYSGQGRGAASLASSESIKVFKGEPFEKAMAGVYAGIYYFNRKDYDNARAAFNKALLAMAQKQESTREDFALAYFLLAKTESVLKNDDNARIALQKASKIYPYESTLFDLDFVRKSNAIFLLELGRAPQKARTGPGDSLIAWMRRSYPERSAQVFVKNQAIGRPLEIADLTAQAASKGRTGKDKVQATKGVAREVSTVTAIVAADAASRGNKTAGWVALGAGLFAVANQSQADVRQWEFLPDLILATGAKIAPGPYAFRAEFFDAGNASLSHLRQSWEYTVPTADDTIFLVPASRCNVNPVIGGQP